MPGFEVLSHAVAWLPWGGAAFARARDEGKPVLLSITAAWCESCREMDRTTYADPSIATIINRRFIPVRVDADQRPDVSERYTLGGWPTTAFLTPDGAVLGGGTFVAAERMPLVLGQVERAFAGMPGQPDAARDMPLPAPEAPPPAAELTRRVFAAFDVECGGFGGEPKFPIAAPLHLALELARVQDPSQYRAIVEATLDAMGWGALYDEVEGGFFRYAMRRGWQSPHSEKMLDTNAALLRLYLEAGAALGVVRFTERAADVLRYIQTWLADPVDGGWWGAQQADARYYAAAPDERRALAPPPVGRVLYADANAAMVSAALHAAAIFNDEGLRDFALKSFERVLLACYKPGAGVAHSFAGHPGIRGLLVDQFTMAAASLDAFEVTGNIVYEMMAEELAHYAVRTMWDEAGGGFFDRAADPAEGAVGLMRRRLKPFALNCDLSRTLRRLAASSGEPAFADLAGRTVTAMAPLAAGQGPLAAHYLLALRAAGSGDTLPDSERVS